MYALHFLASCSAVLPINNSREHRCSRRSLLLTCSSTSLSASSLFLYQAAALEAGTTTIAPAPSPPQLQLVPYQDESNGGFEFLRPGKWTKVDKYGATVLFQDPANKSNSVGVVVSPVRITSLEEFGSAQDVATRLIEAEKKKPSTNSVELVSVTGRTMQLGGGTGDTTVVYEIEYKLDSTRGAKRIYSGVTIADKKLFIINVAVAEGPNDPLDPATESDLKSVVSSFHIISS